MARKEDEIEELIKSGEAKIAEGDFEGAIEAFDKAINLNPADKSQLAEAYIGRGLAKNKLGRREEAIADYDEAKRLCDEAIEIDSENAHAWDNRGFAENELSRHEEAIVDLDEAIRLNPKNATTWSNRGSAKDSLGRYKEAIADFDEAIRLDPKSAASWNNRGLAKDNFGHPQEAITDFDEAIRLNPKNASPWHNRGSVKSQLGLHKEAIADFDEAIRLNPKNAVQWHNRGAAKNELGRHEDAIADYDEVIRLNPKNATAWNNRGSAKAYLQDFDGAIKDVEEACRLSPDDPEVLNNRAAIKAEKAAREAVEKRIGALEADTEEVKGKAEKYERREKRNLIFAYILMFVLAGATLYLVAILIAPNLRPDFLPELEFIDIETPYNLLPFITLIIIIISPLVWTIRLLLVSANKAELMKAEYMHLALVEGRMLVYFPNQDTDEGRRSRADYIKTTMTNSPADKLLAFQNKASVPSSNPVQDIVERTVSKVSDKSSR